MTDRIYVAVRRKTAIDLQHYHEKKQVTNPANAPPPTENPAIDLHSIVPQNWSDSYKRKSLLEKAMLQQVTNFMG
ncbi:hypothetical protein [Chitinophaga sp. RAB17]|uniref:hypothetical protein n=1 Tax=Chitinophaga sp. RAB17 TaxID=3233049 RepID=UPI003F8FBB5D